MNIYAYVGNDPINFVDPSGLAAETAANLGNQALNFVKTNTYDVAHVGLDIAGLVPIVGNVADGANVSLYGYRAAQSALSGDHAGAAEMSGYAALSAAAMVPAAGQLAIVGKYGSKIDPLEGTFYSDKVLRQMKGKDLDHT